MWMDTLTEFADGVTVPTPIATANLGSQVDLQVARDIGNGEPLYLVVQVDTAVTSAGAATVAFQLASDSTAAIDVVGAQTIHWTSRAVPKAELVAGFTMVIPVPQEDTGTPYEQFVGVQAVVGVAVLTAGVASAFLTPDPHGWKSYADASN